jgi:hypothetical protein
MARREAEELGLANHTWTSTAASDDPKKDKGKLQAHV